MIALLALVLFAAGGYVFFRENSLPTPPPEPTSLAARIEAINASDKPIVLVDSTMIITAWSQGMVDQFGYSAASAIGYAPRFLIPDDNSAVSHKEHFTKAINDPDRWNNLNQVYCTARHKDGRDIEVVIITEVVRLDGQVYVQAKIPLAENVRVGSVMP